MASTRVAPGATETVGELASYLRLYERSLRAANRAETTVYKYGLAARQLIAFLTDAGMPTRADAVKREHVEAYIEAFLKDHKASTANTRYQSLRVFFDFLVDEGEIAESPTRNMRPPIVPEQRTAVLTDDDLRALLTTCAGKGFENRRDDAILRLFIDTGMRLAELAGLRVNDLDFTDDVAVVLGKGRRPRACPFGDKNGDGARAVSTRATQARHQRRRALDRDQRSAQRPQRLGQGRLVPLHSLPAPLRGVRLSHRSPR
jgi:site-specific recombinase XerD